MLFAGAGAIFYGIVVANDELSRMMFEELYIASICLGSFLVLLAITALVWARFKSTNKCAMTIYIIVLGLLVLAQVGVVALFIVRQSDVKKFLEDRWNNDLDNHQKWQIQEIFECGVVADEEFYFTLHGDKIVHGDRGEDDDWWRNSTSTNSMASVGGQDDSETADVDADVTDVDEERRRLASTDGDELATSDDDDYAINNDEIEWNYNYASDSSDSGSDSLKKEMHKLLMKWFIDEVLEKSEDFDEKIFNDCYKKIKKDFSKWAALAIAIGLAVLALQVISLIASCCLVCEEQYPQVVLANYRV